MGHLFLKVLFTILFCIAPQTISADDETLENFLGKRYKLLPPTEEQSRAVISSIRVFLDHIAGNDLIEAYFLDTSKEFRAHTSFENFRIFSQNFTGSNLKDKLDFHAVNFTDDAQDKASYMQIYPDKKQHQTSYIKFLLTLEDNKWTISGVEITQTFKTGK